MREVRIFRCFLIASACLLAVFFLLFLFFSIHSLKAPYLLLAKPHLLGKRLGSIDIQWNDRKKASWVYTSRKYSLETHSLEPCLLIYPKFRLNPFPNHALKITKNSIGIFNDTLTECLPMGKYVYESDMTYHVYSVDDDMKGWNAKYEITKEKNGITYKIHHSEYSDRNIVFTVPESFFVNALKSSINP